MLIRSDSAGATKGFLSNIRGLRTIRAAITAWLDWIPALDCDGSIREGAEIACLRTGDDGTARRRCRPTRRLCGSRGLGGVQIRGDHLGLAFAGLEPDHRDAVGLRPCPHSHAEPGADLF